MTTARPILFSAPMIRALLAGTKTQTRRVVKPQPAEGQHVDVCPYSRTGWALWNGSPAAHQGCTCKPAPAPYGFPGGLLYARETWSFIGQQGIFDLYQARPDTCRPIYRADDAQADRWWPSIHMPRWASRITLEVTDIRVERLQDITEEDAAAEGITRIGREYPSFADPDSDWHRAPNLWTVEDGLGSTNAPTAAGAYRMLWELINGAGSWDANPWAWVVTFDVHLKNVDAVLRAKEGAQP